ncbi:NAD(P)-dependent oxidoreductase [Modestobacter excelsi]|uniref:NAD(P)-dependent oxidoreductase n=1 Tax=Modestobacter excelsi TaxID=2213161 RepID=UPI00110CF13A|nr:NAD(P)-dependent oxidoreductase [Modestobacter excelsi]
MSTPDVSLLGLGRMGEPIARRLLTALGALTVWNRTPAKGEPLSSAGARVAARPADAAAAVTLTVLTDLADVEAVLDGEDGLIAGWAAAGVVRPILVVHGTVSPVGVAALAERLAAISIDVVDAPLSGGVAGAESGALSVMVGGAPDAVSRSWPVLSLVGSTVRHLGPPGSGEVAKACNQVVVAGTIGALSEALVLADANGIDRARLLELLGGGLAGSEVLRQKRDRWLTGDFAGGGSTANQLKDLRFVAETAAAGGLDLPISAVLRAVFERAVDDGDGHLDHSGVALSLARHATGER